MTTRAMTDVRRRREAPEAIRSLHAVVDADYVDVFTVSTEGLANASPERWARAGVEHGAGSGGQFVWRGILGLRLDGRPSEDRIGGWTIAERADDWIRLEATSWFLTAHIIVHVGADQVSVATCVHYDRLPARIVWPRLAVVHRRAMPGLLRRAARRTREGAAHEDRV
jgi:hypothetical protein